MQRCNVVGEDGLKEKNSLMSVGEQGWALPLGWVLPLGWALPLG